MFVDEASLVVGMNKITLSSPIRSSDNVVVAELFVNVTLPVELTLPSKILFTTLDIVRGSSPNGDSLL
jgi:hypothetical protein|tara:strand:+ start:4511 stop:4714 length:204 start_codon:yes stop_codon:yes gene_type:complete